MSATLELLETVALIDLGPDENRFSPEWLTSMETALDELLASPATALVTTAGEKFYSNGLQVEQLAGGPAQAGAYIRRVEALLARVLTLPMHTVAAMPGHAFGAGAMLSLAHDAAIMRADRGFICYPEVDLGMNIPVGMAALIQGKLPVSTWVEATTTGRRYGGVEAVAAGMVTETAELPEILWRALARAAAVGAKDRAVVGAIKARIFAPIVHALTAPRDVL